MPGDPGRQHVQQIPFPDAPPGAASAPVLPILPAPSPDRLSAAPTTSNPQATLTAGPAQQVADEDEKDAQEEEHTTLGKLVNKWLPIIVVILLLVGLLAAFVSAFYFPAG